MSSVQLIDESGVVRFKGRLVGGGGGGLTMAISDTDPGAIGAGNLWLRLDPSQSWAPMLYVRNLADDGWADLSGAGLLLGLTFYDGGGNVTASISGSDQGFEIFGPTSELSLAANVVLRGDASATLLGPVGSFHTETVLTRIRHNGTDRLFAAANDTFLKSPDEQSYLFVANDRAEVTATGEVAIQARAGAKIGFFGQAGVVRQQLDPATATPEQIATALIASTFMAHS